MLILANTILNPGQAPLSQAALWIQGEKIAWLGSQTTIPELALEDPDIVSLPDAILAPGLVNAHAHLELSHLSGIPYPGTFHAWIHEVLEHKNQSDPVAQEHAFEKGIMECLQGGATCIGDHVSFNSDPSALLSSPLCGRIFIEVLGVQPELAHDVYDFALQMRDALTEHYRKRDFHPRFTLSASPHSVHALDSGILFELMNLTPGPFSLHIAESLEEYEYFAQQRGGLFDFIASRAPEPRRAYSSAVRELVERKLLHPGLVIVHGNYLDEHEMFHLSQSNASIVHCPLSHQYFGHRPFPLALAQKHRLNLALGTDSLASAASLSMLEVMRQCQLNFLELSKAEIFFMATLGGAKALHLEAEVGSLAPGKWADLIVLKRDHEDPWDDLFVAGEVDFCIVRGKIYQKG